MGLLDMAEALPAGWVVLDQDEDGGRARYAAPDGWVNLAFFELLPGIVMSNIDLACARLPVYYPKGSLLATINWCSTGRCEVDFGTRGSFVVGAQTLCLSSSLAEDFTYPTASYRGFECFVDFDQLDEVTMMTLASFGLTERRLRDALVPHELGVTLSPDTDLLEAIHAIENELALEHPRRSWLLLSVCRLFMLLACESGGSRLTAGYMQRSQRDMAQAVYQQIVENTGTPVELASLAGRFGVSEASLRSYFSRVYGQTPAAFARTHALNEAARLLAQTDQPIAQVSQACGYANPSKFSAAFCRAHGINPLEYRRRSRLA